tara:strand:- start:15403 stop:15666 length:264 start_codon:yes stop_codon:yes gene_type:complete
MSEVLTAKEWDKQESVWSFWRTMLDVADIEVTIGHIDIYKINNKYVLFEAKVPVTDTVEDAFGEHSGVQGTLQDAVEVALLHYVQGI